MEDACGHWFLMVIHIEERKIYHLDSYLVAGQIDGRRQQIGKIVSLVSI
jgi:Ulp1 family protease